MNDKVETASEDNDSASSAIARLLSAVPLVPVTQQPKTTWDEVDTSRFDLSDMYGSRE